MKKLLFTLLGIAGLCCTEVVAQPAFPILVADGKLQYATDQRGNRILDFSFCGYRNSGEAIPDVEVIYTLSPSENDSFTIQGHIDALAARPMNAQGQRGAILLKKGTYYLDEPLRITASGIVLRGESKEETVLVKRGVDRGAVIYIEGEAHSFAVLGCKIAAELGKFLHKSVHLVKQSFLVHKEKLRPHSVVNLGYSGKIAEGVARVFFKPLRFVAGHKRDRDTVCELGEKGDHLVVLIGGENADSCKAENLAEILAGLNSLVAIFLCGRYYVVCALE